MNNSAHSAVCVFTLTHACTMWNLSSFLPSFLPAVLCGSSHLVPLSPQCWNGSSVPDRNENENRYFGFQQSLLAWACRGKRCEGGGKNRMRCSMFGDLTTCLHCWLLGQPAKRVQFESTMWAGTLHLDCFAFNVIFRKKWKQNLYLLSYDQLFLPKTQQSSDSSAISICSRNKVENNGMQIFLSARRTCPLSQTCPGVVPTVFKKNSAAC